MTSATRVRMRFFDGLEIAEPDLLPVIRGSGGLAGG